MRPLKRLLLVFLAKIFSIKIELRSQQIKSIVGALTTAILILLFGLTSPQPGLAQSTAPAIPNDTVAADVVVDGRVLFRLGSIPGFTAKARAESVNRDLQAAIRTTPFDQDIRVGIVERDRLSTIRVNNRHLLSITNSDFRMGVSPQEQAEDWVGLLQTSLANAQRERSPDYARAVIWQIAAALVAAITLYILIRFDLQNIVNNFISGWILLIERPVQVGDLVDVGAVLGTVDHIGMRSTQLKTADGFSIILPSQDKRDSDSITQPAICATAIVRIAFSN